ncbi:universal stress protein Sll1388-like [Mercenaria mercenaria]|uniref:universal stress protein Sll1388-like n=1 Tax=Mercenaria mercenaria TaxID=6596 RepID=UPI00234F6247|nr:universal stress protein Sll1388-like [Mercenaria mercenaria]
MLWKNENNARIRVKQRLWLVYSLRYVRIYHIDKRNIKMADQEKAVGTKKDSVTVVIAMDGSEYSDYALQFYKDCLHRPGNKVLIAHNIEYKIVSHPAVAVMTGAADSTLVTREIEQAEVRAAELVERLKQRMTELQVEGSVEKIHGETGPSIVTFATDNKADYIVVGCRGKGVLRKTFTGSVTDYITHHSHVPVIVARNIDHLEKLHLHMPSLKIFKKGDGPGSPK